MKLLILFPVVLFGLVPHSTEAFFLSNLYDMASNILEGAISSANNLINIAAPPNAYDNIDNTATRLMKTIASTSAGVLQESIRAINKTKLPETEETRSLVLSDLNLTEATPSLTRNLISLLSAFVETVPRSTLDESGILSAIPQIIPTIEDLLSIANETQLRPLVGDLENLALNLVINIKNMRALSNLPKSLIYLHEHLLRDREKILSDGQVLINANSSQVVAVTQLITSVDALVNAVPTILQSLQNTISNTRLSIENYTSSVIAQVQKIVKDQLDQVPQVLGDITGSLQDLTDVIDTDINQVLNYNDEVMAKSKAAAENFTGTGLDLLNKQILSTILAIQKSSVPTASIIAQQLKSLLNTTEGAITHSVTTSSNDLYTSFDGTLGTLEKQISKGSSNTKPCVNLTVNGVENISKTAVEGLVSCALTNVEDTKKFITAQLDATDEQLGDIGELAVQLETCLKDYDPAGGSIATLKVNSCLQTLQWKIRGSDILSKLSIVQTKVTNMINSVHSKIHSCIYETFYAADNSASTLEMTSEQCFRSF